MKQLSINLKDYIEEKDLLSKFIYPSFNNPDEIKSIINSLAQIKLENNKDYDEYENKLKPLVYHFIKHMIEYRTKIMELIYEYIFNNIIEFDLKSIKNAKIFHCDLFGREEYERKSVITNFCAPIYDNYNYIEPHFFTTKILFLENDLLSYFIPARHIHNVDSFDTFIDSFLCFDIIDNDTRVFFKSFEIIYDGIENNKINAVKICEVKNGVFYFNSDDKTIEKYIAEQKSLLENITYYSPEMRIKNNYVY